MSEKREHERTRIDNPVKVDSISVPSSAIAENAISRGELELRVRKRSERVKGISFRFLRRMIVQSLYSHQNQRKRELAHTQPA